MTPEERKSYQKKYYAEHREERKAYQRQYQAEHSSECRKYREEHREERKAHNKQWREEHREERKAYKKKRYSEHREERKARQKKYRAEHRDQIREGQKRRRRKDLNSQGKEKHCIRALSSYILKKSHAKLPGYQIHHCFGYDDPNFFIYIPKSLHLQIHQLLRDKKIPADSDHWDAIRELVNSCEEYVYIRC